MSNINSYADLAAAATQQVAADRPALLPSAPVAPYKVLTNGPQPRDYADLAAQASALKGG